MELQNFDKMGKVIILIGPPGSGKGTQAELLAEKLGLFYFETSKIGEAKLKQAKKGDCVVINGQKYSLAQEKKLSEKGILWTPEVVAFWVKQEIEKLSNQGKSLVLAGSPRTLYEGKELIPLLKKLYDPKNIQIILIKLSKEQTIWRNTRRRICSECRRPIFPSEETKKLTQCPKCGAKLVVREDDKKETIKVRLKEYEERTKPLIEYFKEEGLKIKEVEGEQSIEDVHKDILEVVG